MMARKEDGISFLAPPKINIGPFVWPQEHTWNVMTRSLSNVILQLLQSRLRDVPLSAKQMDALCECVVTITPLKAGKVHG